jgi:gas vesicle protein
MAEKREFLLGMCIGSAIGAAVALLYAPQAGEDTRDLIRQKTTDAKEKVTEVAGTVKQTVAEKADTVKSSATELMDKGRGFVESKKALVTAAVDAGKQAFTQKKSELEADVNEDLEATLGSSSSSNAGGSPA